MFQFWRERKRERERERKKKREDTKEILLFHDHDV